MSWRCCSFCLYLVVVVVVAVVVLAVVIVVVVVVVGTDKNSSPQLVLILEACGNASADRIGRV